MRDIRAESAELQRELVERVHKFGPVFADGVAEGERERRLPEATIRAIDQAQLAMIWTAKHYGGLEANVVTMSEVAKALSQYCPSTSWVVNNINGSNLLAAKFPRQALDEVFGDNPGAKLASVFAAAGTAVRAEGGYRLTGTWPYGTGILHDDWAILVAREVDDAGEPVGGLSMLVPAADTAIEDTWHTVGMRATGSHTVVLRDVFVPEHRVISGEAQRSRDNATELGLPPLFRTAGIAAMAVVCASVVLGAGQAALARVVEKAPTRGIAPSKYSRQTDSQTFVSSLGRTALSLDAAEMHVRRAATALDDAAYGATSLPDGELLRIRGDVGRAVGLVTTALDELLWAHGAASFAESNPLQQYWRDANTAARHAMLNMHIGHELYGGSFFGLDPIVPSI
ncbi:acyl-CoA dehydrogenase family protein [Streptomyces cacaoi]|uniref:acyl-CoA dehydrogenase family protein n=1 Tax=Streptomyces cacaoi TaxID=1898 RepID=UPI0037487F46